MLWLSPSLGHGRRMGLKGILWPAKPIEEGNVCLDAAYL